VALVIVDLEGAVLLIVGYAIADRQGGSPTYIPLLLRHRCQAAAQRPPVGDVGIAQNDSAIRRLSRWLEMREIARIVGSLFATGALLFIVAAAILAGVVWTYQQGLPDYSRLENYEPPVMTRVHAADGSLLAEYSRERRLYLP
jgi:hypothetical protein